MEITKAQLAKLAKHYGAVNSTPFDGNEPGTLRFVSFIGAIDLKTKKYVGDLRFDKCKATPDDARYDFTKLLKGDKDVSNDNAHDK